MSSNEIELPLQPTGNAVVNEHARAGDRAASAALAARLKKAGHRGRAKAAAARKRLVRASLEARAMARSSAALSGIAADFGRIRRGARPMPQAAKIDQEAPKAHRVRAGFSQAGADLRAVGRALADDTERFAKELPGELRRMRVASAEKAHALALRLKRAEVRGKSAAMRSSTISGLAIDSRRIVRRLKAARERRRMAH